MQYPLALHNAGKTVAQYRGRHPISGQAVTLYAPYDNTIALLNPPQFILVTVDAITQEDMELTA